MEGLPVLLRHPIERDRALGIMELPLRAVDLARGCARKVPTIRTATKLVLAPTEQWDTGIPVARSLKNNNSKEYFW